MSAPSTWEFAADDVLSVMLNDERERDRAVYELAIMPAHMPSIRHRRLFEAIRDCMTAGEQIHDTTLLERCGSVVPLDWLAQVTTLYDPTRPTALADNARILRKYGMIAGTRTILKIADDELASGKTHDSVVPRLLTALTSLDGSGRIEGETADAMSDSFDAMMDAPPVALKLTGIPWLDRLTNGVEPGHIWWIAAPYKSRKSTVMLNMALGLLMTWFTRGCAGEPPSIGILSGEMSRERVQAQIISMLAVANLKRRNLWTESFMTGSASVPLHWLSAKILLNARGSYRQWDPRRVEAIDYGRMQYAGFGKNLRVYDRSLDGGKLTDLATLFRVMRRDIHLHGANVLFVDYLQLFQPHDMKLFEYMSLASRQLQAFAAAEKVTLVVLAQQNEDTVKNGSSYSAGIKGGGDAASTADYLLSSLYKTGDYADDPTKLLLTMKLSRHGDGGGNASQALTIHPNSGLLLESDWIGRI